MWPENWSAVETFLALATQWRYAGQSAIPSGIDYCAVEPVLRLLGREASRELFDQLRILEAEALGEFARRRG